MNNIIPARQEQIKNSFVTSLVGGSLYTAASYITPLIIEVAGLGTTGQAVANLASGLFKLIGGGVFVVGASELNTQLGLTDAIRSKANQAWTELNKPRIAQSEFATSRQYMGGAILGAAGYALTKTLLNGLYNPASMILSGIVGSLAVKTTGDIYAAFAESPPRIVVDPCPCNGVCAECPTQALDEPNGNTPRIGQSYVQLLAEVVAGSVVGYLSSWALPVSPFIGMLLGSSVAKNVGDLFYVRARPGEPPLVRQPNGAPPQVQRANPRGALGVGPAAAAAPNLAAGAAPNPAAGVDPAIRQRTIALLHQIDAEINDFANYIIDLSNGSPNPISFRIESVMFHVADRGLADRIQRGYDNSQPQHHNEILRWMLQHGADPAELQNPDVLNTIRELARQKALSDLIQTLAQVYPNISILDPQGQEMNPRAQPRRMAGQAPQWGYQPPRGAYRRPQPQFQRQRY